MNPLIKEARLRQEFLEGVLESAPDAIITVNADGIVTVWNNGAEKLFGYTSTEAIGKDIDQLVALGNPIKYKEAVSLSRQVASKQPIGPFETVRYRKDGTPVNVILSSSPVSINGKLEGGVVVYTDITNRVQVEEALRESEEKYRSFVQKFQGIAYRSKMNFIPEFFHGAVEEITGYTEDEFVAGKPRWDQIIHPDDLALIFTDDEKKLHTIPNYSFEREYRIIRKDGQIRWVHEIIQNIWDDNGNPPKVQGTIYNITKHKQMEKSLRESENRFRSLIEQSPISTTLFTPDGKPTYGNPATAELWQMSPELMQYVYESYNILDDRQLINQRIMPNIQKGFSGEYSKTRPIRYDPKLTNPNYIGPARWLKAFISPVKDENGRINEVVVLHVDVTEQKKAQEALEASHERLVTILDSIDADVYVSDMETNKILFMNQHMKASFDGNFVGQTCWKAFRGESEPCSDCTNDQLLDAEGNPVGVVAWEGQNPITERWYINYDRAIKWVDNRTVRLQVSTDITKRVRTEMALQQSEQFLQNVFDAIQDGISVLDTDLNVVRTNNWMEQKYREHAPLKDRKCFQVYQQRLSPCPWCPSLRTIETGETNIEVVPYPTVENPTGWIELSAFPVKDEQGKVINIIEYVKDITKRKLAEDEIQEYTSQIEALLEIEKAITSTLDLEKLLESIMTELANVVPYDSISLQILRDTSLEIIACQGFYNPDNIIGLVFPLDPKFPNHQVILTKKPLAIDDITHEHPHFAEESGIYGSGHIHSWLGVPLISKGILIGMITMDRTDVVPFSEIEIQMASAVASQAALAIENARLFSEAKRRLDRLSSLQNIDKAITTNLDLDPTLDTLLEHVLRQLEVDAAAILLYTPEGEKLEFAAGRGFHTQALKFTKLDLGEGFAGKAALERRIVHFSELSQHEAGFLRSLHFHEEKFLAYIGVPLIAKGNIIGVLEIYHRQHLNPDHEWMSFLETLAAQAAIAIENVNLLINLQKSNVDLMEAYDATIEGWAQALEIRDMETEGHSRRVVKMTLRLAEMLDVREEEFAHIRRGAQLHDIGKMGVPDAILQKPGKLNADEWKIMQQHPVYAHKWLSQISYLKPALDIPYCHHEKWDGSGYPRGLKGEEIPFAARIFAVVDVWDALRSDRPYRKAWSESKVLEYIELERNKHFDPQVIDAFFKLREFR